MDPHIGRAVNHYKRLLDIEFTENKYLEEVYDSLFPWVEHVERMWHLIIEALDDFQGFKIFRWLKHIKNSKAYQAAVLIRPIFARIKSIPKYSPYFYTYYYPILNISQTTVLPYTSFRTPHFKRKILITQEFAHNYHIQSFLRFARVLIRQGFKKRALRMLKYCLIHLKKKYSCYSSSNALLGAVRKTTPDLIKMPFLKGKVKEQSIIPARSIRRFSEAVRNLYSSAYFRRRHLDWGLDFFVGKKFEHVLAEEIIDVVKDKYDCTTLKRIRQYTIDLTQMGRSRYTRKVGVMKYTPYDFAERSLQYIFSSKPEKYEIPDKTDARMLKIKGAPFETKETPFELNSFILKKQKLKRLLYSKPTLQQYYNKTYGFNKIQHSFKKKLQLKKNKPISKIKTK
jgi:ribosomal protein S7